MNTTPTPAQILSNKVVAAIRLADVVGRSRGINGFAVNENAVRQLVDMETEILDALAQPALAAPVMLVGFLNTVAALMRTIDAYAFDYQKDGKLAATRGRVLVEIGTALAAQQPTPAASPEWRDEQNQPGVPRQVNDAGGIRSGVYVAQVMQPVEASPDHAQGCSALRAGQDACDCWYLRQSGSVEVAAPVAPTSKTYTTQPGESIRGIALRQLGNEDRWGEIYDCNCDRFPDVGQHEYYRVGTVLDMPADGHASFAAKLSAALTAAKPEPLSDAQINEAWGRYDEGVETQRDVFERILALQAGGAEA